MIGISIINLTFKEECNVLAKFNKKLLATMIFSSAFLIACGGDDGSDGADGVNGNDGNNGLDGQDGQNGVDSSNSFIQLNFLSRFETEVFDESAAEIVSFDPTTQQAFVVNAASGQIDVLDLSTPSAPVLASSLDVAADVAGAIDSLADASALGDANSVSVSGANVAVAIAADNTQENGYVAFYQTDGSFLSAVEVGALPDMVTFTPDGNTVLVANEGEPNDDYSVDPEGSISKIDVSGGVAIVTNEDVTAIGFTDFNEGGTKTLGENVRVAAIATSVAADLEPEFIAVSADGNTAWVMLQENNALAIVDLSNDEVTDVIGLGYIDHSIPGNELDASNRDEGINIQNWPLRGVFMPDSADAYEVNGTTYIVTANEGDSREYETDTFSYIDEIRIADIVDPDEAGATIDLENVTRYADSIESLTADENLGRIKVITNLGVECTDNTSIETTGQPDETCTYTELYSFGSRSFSIWNGSTGELVFDSGSDFELITAERLGEDFNATNDENGGDNRSDDKGPEPEAIEIAEIAGKTYAFIGLERVGGIMVYEISNPQAPEFVQYINARDFSVDVETLVDDGDFSAVGDLGPESIYFVSATDSPSGAPLLIVGNEVSGTTTIFSIDVLNQQ